MNDKFIFRRYCDILIRSDRPVGEFCLLVLSYIYCFYIFAYSLNNLCWFRREDKCGHWMFINKDNPFIKCGPFFLQLLILFGWQKVVRTIAIQHTKNRISIPCLWDTVFVFKGHNLMKIKWSFVMSISNYE